MASGCWILLVFSFFFIHFVGIYPVEGVNCPPSSRGTEESSKKMRSARKGSHSFECIPAPIDLGSRAASVQGSHRLIQSARRSIGRSQDVIKTIPIKSRFNVSSVKLKHEALNRLRHTAFVLGLRPVVSTGVVATCYPLKGTN